MSIISTHPEAVPFLENNISFICWNSLSANPGAMHLIYANLNKINWSMLSRNSFAYDLLNNNKDKIDWNELGHNTSPNTHFLYNGNIDKITYWMPICQNKSSWINYVLDNNIEKLNKNEIKALSSNSYAIPIIRKYIHLMDKIALLNNEFIQQGIYGNANPDAYELFQYLDNKVANNYCASSVFVPYLHNNRDKIDRNILYNCQAQELIEWYYQKNKDLNSYWWKIISKNNAAINIIKANLDKVDWSLLSLNSAALSILELYQNNIDWNNLVHNPGIYASTFANNNVQSFYFGRTEGSTARETRVSLRGSAQSENEVSLRKTEGSTARETRVFQNINNTPIINFDKLTIDYDEDYVDEELKPLYVVSNSKSESESDYDSDYY